MKLFLLLGFLFLPASLVFARPNVLILLANDLGFQDIGCYGAPVKTPALDALAAGGTRSADLAAEHPEVLERMKNELLKINVIVVAEGPDWHLPSSR